MFALIIINSCVHRWSAQRISANKPNNYSNNKKVTMTWKEQSGKWRKNAMLCSYLVNLRLIRGMHIKSAKYWSWCLCGSGGGSGGNGSGGITKVTTLHPTKSACNTSFNYGCIDNVCVCVCVLCALCERMRKYAICVHDSEVNEIVKMLNAVEPS